MKWGNGQGGTREQGPLSSSTNKQLTSNSRLIHLMINSGKPTQSSNTHKAHTQDFVTKQGRGAYLIFP